jgi:YD repeat-containing protein
MTRTWVDGAPPFLSAANLNALETDVTTALGVPDAALAARVVAGATATALNATYDQAFAASSSIVYDPATGNVTSNTEGGITTAYTYNADGTVNTETRLGKVRTWAYDANGNPTSSTVV